MSVKNNEFYPHTLSDAITQNDTLAVQSILRKCNSIRKDSGELYLACELGRLEIVEVLLDAGFNPSSASHGGMGPPLHAATFKGHTGIVRILIASEGILAQHLNSALLLAWRREWTDIIHLLQAAGATNIYVPRNECPPIK